jgi:DNA adenine methylase
MNYVYAPLRYPGGKAKLAPFIKRVFEENRLCDGHYVEPYAGGAGIGLSLLLTEYSRHIHLNDISYPLYCLWDTILNSTEYLVRRIRNVNVTPTTWRRQKRILRSPYDYTPSEAGFAFLFLNRTNRSGIVNGGMIGGKGQTGKWKIDARFGRPELVRRIEAIAQYRERISIYCMDAMAFMQMITPQLPAKSLLYLDPPYYVKGSRLYPDYYRHEDHEHIAEYVQQRVTQPWIVTYDNVPEIGLLYACRNNMAYDLDYSASTRRKGTELMFFSDSLKVPASTSPVFWNMRPK